MKVIIITSILLLSITAGESNKEPNTKEEIVACVAYVNPNNEKSNQNLSEGFVIYKNENKEEKGCKLTENQLKLIKFVSENQINIENSNPDKINNIIVIKGLKKAKSHFSVINTNNNIIEIDPEKKSLFSDDCLFQVSLIVPKQYTFINVLGNLKNTPDENENPNENCVFVYKELTGVDQANIQQILTPDKSTFKTDPMFVRIIKSYDIEVVNHSINCNIYLEQLVMAKKASDENVLKIIERDAVNQKGLLSQALISMAQPNMNTYSVNKGDCRIEITVLMKSFKKVKSVLIRK